MAEPAPDYMGRLDIISDCAGKGLTHDEIADYLGIGTRTFRYWCKHYPEVYAAYRKGRADAKMYVAGRLFGHIQEGNLIATIFYLKTKGGFSEHRSTDEDRPADSDVGTVALDEGSESRVKELIRESEEEFREVDRRRASEDGVDTGGE